MSLVLQVVLAFLVRFVLSASEDVQVVLIPPIRPEHTEFEVPIDFTAFGEKIQLKLKRNDKLLSPNFQIWRHDVNGHEKLPKLAREVDPSCFYLHRGDSSSAAISLCQHDAVEGIVFMNNVTLEITPVASHEDHPWNSILEKRSDDYFGEPHLVKRSYVSSWHELKAASSRPHLPTISAQDSMSNEVDQDLHNHKSSSKNSKDLTIELAIFFDEVAYKSYSSFFDYKEENLRDMLMAYVNGIQALYYHPSLGSKIDISLVRLDLMRTQPPELPHHQGERLDLLLSFCDYSAKLNPESDDDPGHWDIGLYVSSLDFFHTENNRKSTGTMGLATVGGVCTREYSCVIAELGVNDQWGKPYPSAGFNSVYIAAHEIGHSLGMHHDSTGNTCTKEGYIMSPTRGTEGETYWSWCSKEIAMNLPKRKTCLLDSPPGPVKQSLDHEKYYKKKPGRTWSAKRQCEFLLRDKEAYAITDTLEKACSSLRCATTRRSGYYFAGPALSGTYCGPGKECEGGDCISASYSVQTQKDGQWGPWTVEQKCSSGCIDNAKGFQVQKRQCNDPEPTSQGKPCRGLSTNVLLCDDTSKCKRRKSPVDYASGKCKEFSSKVAVEAKGLQATHEGERPWMACAIFCRNPKNQAYYAPRVELNDLGLDAYFPDGTWCHEEKGEDYYCMRHHCLPESFRFTEKLTDVSLWANREFPSDHVLGDDDFNLFDIGPQNAGAVRKMKEELINHLTVKVQNSKKSTKLRVKSATVTSDEEEEEEDKDYIELPADYQRVDERIDNFFM